MDEITRLKAERDFLLLRASKAGSASFSSERWTGLSSNALVEVAFGQANDWLPSDGADLAACYRTVQRLPAHLRNEAVLAQLAKGEANVSADSLAWAREITGWDRDRDCSGEASETRSGSTGTAKARPEGIAQ